ncbi:MAG: hypothetical protein CL912_16720 [Deltaproteobacteria bacterium]|nr:hypothetical protein [Deltaproteobacteria bacterium]
MQTCTDATPWLLSWLATTHFSPPRTRHIPPSPIEKLFDPREALTRPLAMEQILMASLSLEIGSSCSMPETMLRTWNLVPLMLMPRGRA